MVTRLRLGFVGLIAVLVVIGVAACGGSGSEMDAGSATSPSSSAASAPKTAEKPKDDKGDAHAVLAANTSTQINETKNRIHGVTLLEIRDPATSDNEFLQPSDGNRFWAVNVQIENAGTDSVSVGSWKLRGSNDFEYDRTFMAGIDPSLDPLQSLTAGGKTAGWIVFELPEDVQPKWLRYDPNPFLGKDLYFDAA